MKQFPIVFWVQKHITASNTHTFESFSGKKQIFEDTKMKNMLIFNDRIEITWFICSTFLEEFDKEVVFMKQFSIALYLMQK